MSIVLCLGGFFVGEGFSRGLFCCVGACEGSGAGVVVVSSVFSSFDLYMNVFVINDWCVGPTGGVGVGVRGGGLYHGSVGGSGLLVVLGWLGLGLGGCGG